MPNIDWNPNVTWWGLIEQRVALTPGRTMLRDDRGRSLTYAQYREESERAAACLYALGVRADDIVSWQVPTSIEAFVLMGALGRLSAKQNPIVPILRRAEISVIMRQLRSRWYVTPGSLRGFDYTALAREVTEGFECGIVELPLAERTGSALALPSGDPTTLPPFAPRDDVRWYFYTSGTTAEPKGVKHRDATVLASATCAGIYGFDETTVYPIAFPISHIGGMAMAGALMLYGHQLCLFETFDPASTPEAMAAMKPTNLGTAVPFFNAYLDAQKRHGSEPLFPELRACSAGGAPTPPELMVRVREELGGVGIINAWGMTECPSPISMRPTDPLEKMLAGSIGRPPEGVDVKIVDGEICIKAPQLFVGYVDESLMETAFTDDGYYRTGDLGEYDDDGFLYLTGRSKDIIIRNAENISALEIENVLHEHPAVRDVAVVGLPDPRTGERAVAVIVLAEGAEPLSLAQLAEHCAAKGLSKQKTPEQVEFVEGLPRNAMGKLLKHEIRANLVS